MKNSARISSTPDLARRLSCECNDAILTLATADAAATLPRLRRILAITTGSGVANPTVEIDKYFNEHDAVADCQRRIARPPRLDWKRNLV